MKRLLGLLLAVMVMMGGNFVCGCGEHEPDCVRLADRTEKQTADSDCGGRNRRGLDALSAERTGGRGKFLIRSEFEGNALSPGGCAERQSVAAVDFEAAGRPVESKRAERPRFDAGRLDAAKFFCYVLRKL